MKKEERTVSVTIEIPAKTALWIKEKQYRNPDKPTFAQTVTRTLVKSHEAYKTRMTQLGREED